MDIITAKRRQSSTSGWGICPAKERFWDFPILSGSYSTRYVSQGQMMWPLRLNFPLGLIPPKKVEIIWKNNCKTQGCTSPPQIQEQQHIFLFSSFLVTWSYHWERGTCWETWATCRRVGKIADLFQWRFYLCWLKHCFKLKLRLLVLYDNHLKKPTSLACGQHGSLLQYTGKE